MELLTTNYPKEQIFMWGHFLYKGILHSISMGNMQYING